MEQLDSDIQSLEEQVRELQRKKRELEDKRIKLANQLTVHITHFSPGAGRVHVKLSKYRSDVVDWLRWKTDRIYNDTTGNIFSVSFLEDFLSFIQKDDSIELLWDSKSLDKYNEWKAKPDLLVDIKGNYIYLELGPKVSNIYLLSHISSFQRHESGYRFALAEFYRFPEAIQSQYPNITPIYTDNAKEILLSQIERRKMLAQLANATDVELENPFQNGYDLKPHQRVAVKFVELCNFKSIVAYDMGTGKSAIAIALAERHPEWKKILVICPASLKINWKREISKFTNQPAHMFSGIEPDGTDIDAWVDPSKRYYIINYDIIGRKIGKGDDGVMKWVTLFNALKPDFVAIDEAHYIKNMDSNRSIGVRSLQYDKVIPMSGTPLVNRPLELYPPLSIVAPESFSSPAAFTNNFTNNDGTARNVKQLHDIISSFMIRRTRKDVYGDKIHIERIPFSKELSPQARSLYTKILEGIYISLRKPDYQRNVTSIFAELIRCKQTCSADNISTSAELCLDAIEETEKKVIIFSQFKESQAGIQQILGDQAEIINGDIKDEERYKTVDRFQDPSSNTKVIITNILEGLTLTEAHTVIFNDIWWTPKDHYQAEGRAFGRDNDPHGGNSYWLENEQTIDQFLNALLIKKMAVFSEVIDGVKNAQEEQGSIMNQLIEHLKGAM